MKKDFEGSFGGGFEDGNSPEIRCSEAEWKQFLDWADREVERFKRFYASLEIRPGEDRLDKCALAMGWQLDGNEDETKEEIVKMFGEDFAITPPPGPPPVYSLLNTTEAVAIRAIIAYAREHLLAIYRREGPSLLTFGPETTLGLSGGFAAPEQAMLLAIDAISARENALAKLLMKRAHAAWNDYLGLLPNLLSALPKSSRISRRHYDDLREAIFDLRELCLRIIRDAREAEREDTED